MTVGFFSPLPPARTGVADYAAALLAELRRHGQVEVAPARCDAALYHLGNNGLHADIYRRAIERSRSGGAARRRAASFPSGAIERAAVRGGVRLQLRRVEPRAGAGVVARARGVRRGQPVLRVSHAAARRGARARRGGAQPGGGRRREGTCSGRARGRDSASVRAPATAGRSARRCATGSGWAWTPGVFLFGVFGYLRESKRLHPVLEAFAEVHGASAAGRPADRRRSSFRPTWSARWRRCCARPASCACRTSRSANSGWRRAPWMPASTCAIRRPGRLRASPSADGHRQAGAADRRRSPRAFPEDACLRIARGPGGTRTPCAST